MWEWIILHLPVEPVVETIVPLDVSVVIFEPLVVFVRLETSFPVIFVSSVLFRAKVSAKIYK